MGSDLPGVTRKVVTALGFRVPSGAPHCLPSKLRKSPVLGLAGSINLALFKVAIICPISRWLQKSSPGRQRP